MDLGILAPWIWARPMSYQIEVRNSLQLFDGNHMHGTMPFRGDRYAIILYAIGTEHYKQTSGHVRAFLGELRYQTPLAEFKEEIREEHLLHAQMMVRGEKVPDEPGRHIPPKGKRKPVDPTTPRLESSKRRSKPPEPVVKAENSHEVREPHVKFPLRYATFRWQSHAWGRQGDSSGGFRLFSIDQRTLGGFAHLRHDLFEGKTLMRL